MNSSEICIITTSTDKIENANYITSKLIESKLVVCIQLDKVFSTFYWEEKICELDEFRLMIKALSANYGRIEKAIKKYHNYTLPEIIKFDAAYVLPEYLDWVKKNSSMK